MRRRLGVVLLLLGVALAGTIQTAMADDVSINIRINATMFAGEGAEFEISHRSSGALQNGADSAANTTTLYSYTKNNSFHEATTWSTTETANGGFAGTNVISMSSATDGSTVQTTTEAHARAENGGTSTANAFSYADARDNSHAGNNTVATAGNNEDAWAAGISLAARDAEATTSMENEFGFAMAFGGATAHADGSGAYCDGNGGRALVISSTGVCID